MKRSHEYPAGSRKHIGSDAAAFVRKDMARDPELARLVADEFARIHLAAAVRRLRQRRKLSQGDLAERAGTKQPAIARLEAGRTMPRLDLLLKIASALNTRLDVRFLPAH